MPGHCGAEVIERADSYAKESIKEGRDSQLLRVLTVADLRAQWKKKGKEDLHSFCQNKKETEEKVTLEGTTGMAHLHGSTR
jgi:hypothetical protein